MGALEQFELFGAAEALEQWFPVAATAGAFGADLDMLDADGAGRALAVGDADAAVPLDAFDATRCPLASPAPPEADLLASVKAKTFG